MDDTTDILMNQHVMKDDTSVLFGSGYSGENFDVEEINTASGYVEESTYAIKALS